MGIFENLGTIALYCGALFLLSIVLHHRHPKKSSRMQLLVLSVKKLKNDK